MHVVVTEGREDKQFIAERTAGWETFRQRILAVCGKTKMAIGT